MRRLLILAVCTLVGAPVLSAGTWTHASSEHFEISTTGGDRRAREALAYFERVHAYFFAQPGLSPQLTRPVRLVVFSSAREFSPYRPYDAALAYYRSSPDRDYIVMQSFGPEAYPVVVHEFVHMILTRLNVRYPVWLNEGLAEYYSTVSLLGTLATVGRAPESRVKDLTDARLLPLERLFAVTREAAEYRTAEHAGLFYAQSWALTHMLLADDRYRAASNRLLGLVRDGANAATAFRTVYGKSVKDLEGDLNDYVRDGRFIERTTAYKPPPQFGDVSVRAMSVFDADLALANLLAAGRESRAKARVAFEDLARQRPDDLSLLESRAAFELRSGSTPVARSYFARAVDLGSTDVQTYRDYASLVVRSEPALAEQLLRTAVSLQPADVATRVRLGALMASRDPAGVLAVLESVGGPNPPAAFSVFQLRANAHRALNHLELAHEAALDLLRVAVSRQQRTLAASLLASVEKSLAAQINADAVQQSGIRLTVRETRDGSSSLTQILMDRNHVRVEQDGIGLVALFDAAQPVAYQVDAVRKRYAAFDREEFGRMRQEIQDRLLATLAPEQRQQAVDAMGRAGGPPSESPALPQPTYRKAGPDTVGGRECVRYELVPPASVTDSRVPSNASTTEVCVAPPQAFGLGADDFAIIGKYVRHMSEVVSGVMSAPGGQDAPYLTGVADGQPFSGVSLRVIKRFGATTRTSEVVSVQREVFPPSMFALPADLQKVSIMAIMSR